MKCEVWRFVQIAMLLLVFCASARGEEGSFAQYLQISFLDRVAIEEPFETVRRQSFTPAPHRFSLKYLHSVTWVKLEITNPYATRQQWYLHNAMPYLSNNIHIYSEQPEGGYQNQYINVDDVSARDVLVGSSVVLPINIAPGETQHIYYRNQSDYAQIYHFALFDLKGSQQALINKNYIRNVIVTFMFSLAMYNLILFFFGERRELLFYSLYIFTSAMGLAYLYGSVSHNLRLYGIYADIYVLTSLLIPTFLSAFVKHTFETSTREDLSDRMLNVVICVSIGCLLTAPLVSLSFAVRLIPVTFGLSFISLIYLAVKLYQERHPLIVLFLIAHGTFILTLSVLLACLYGFIPFNEYTYLSSGAGLMFEALMFSYLLRFRVKALESEVEQRKRAEYKLTEMAYRDDLTNLPNRRLFFEIAENILHQAKRNKQQCALLFIDIDGFKAVNDSLGHESGDSLLIEIAGRLKASLRASDLLARMGGDEFVVLLGELDDEIYAARAAESIISMLSTPFELPLGTVEVGASIGISYYPRHGASIDTLMSAADKAMYKVKKTEKNSWHVCAVS